MPHVMTALPAPEIDPDVERLRSFVERDDVMKEVIEDVKELLTRRPSFQRHWLLKLDRINKRFVPTVEDTPPPVQSLDRVAQE
jgi:hypothetical protein